MTGWVFSVLGMALVAIGRAGMRRSAFLTGPFLPEEQRQHTERVVQRGARVCMAVGVFFVAFAILWSVLRLFGG